jgi:hypothetical protein
LVYIVTRGGSIQAIMIHDQRWRRGVWVMAMAFALATPDNPDAEGLGAEAKAIRPRAMLPTIARVRICYQWWSWTQALEETRGDVFAKDLHFEWLIMNRLTVEQGNNWRIGQTHYAIQQVAIGCLLALVTAAVTGQALATWEKALGRGRQVNVEKVNESEPP